MTSTPTRPLPQSEATKIEISNLDKVLSRTGADDRVRLGGRLILHLLRMGAQPEDQTALVGSSQLGIAQSLSVTRSAVSKVISPLISAGEVREVTLHIRGEVRRVRAYYLTEAGHRLAAELRAIVEPRAVRQPIDRGASDKWV